MTPSAQAEVNHDPQFQERFWVVVRIGWAIMGVVLLAALLGLTGSGGVMSSQSLAAGPARIDFPAISRWAAADSMTVTSPNRSTQMTVTLPASFGDTFSIDAVSPSPKSVVGSARGDIYVFELEPGAGQVSINFAIRAARPTWPTKLTPFEIDGFRSDPASVTVLP